VGKYYGQIHYPGIVIAQADFDKLPEAQKETFRSFTTNWDRGVLREQILQAVTVAKKLGLPLFCGEWGVISSSPRESAYNWYRDMISVFDEFDIGWTTWNYDSGFGFWNSYSKQVSDKTMLEILTSGNGLK
jgi:endoglucanase